MVVVAYKKRLRKPGVLATAMDLFCFYRGRLMPERYAFGNLQIRKTSLFVTKASFSMFKLFRPNFEAILLSVRELLLV